MIKRHKVFISFHHQNDEVYKNRFIEYFSNSFDGFISKAVSDGDINPYNKTETTRQLIRDNNIRDASVTIVLLGQETWKRKHVDWEISASIRETKYNSRTGLIGILLPTYNPGNTYNIKACENSGIYNPHNIPPRLYDNIKCGFAKIYSWDNNPFNVQSWIHDAFTRRSKITPDNSFPSYSNNRSAIQSEWTY